MTWAGRVSVLGSVGVQADRSLERERESMVQGESWGSRGCAQVQAQGEEWH